MKIPTAALVAVGLVGGYSAARFTGRRPLGGAVLAVAGGLAAKQWAQQVGPVGAVALTTVYVGAFGASHPLAKKIGAWPSVGVVTAAATAAAAVADARGR